MGYILLVSLVISVSISIEAEVPIYKNVRSERNFMYPLPYSIPQSNLIPYQLNNPLISYPPQAPNLIPPNYGNFMYPISYPNYHQKSPYNYPNFNTPLLPYPYTSPVYSQNPLFMDPKNYPHIKTEIIDIEDDGKLSAYFQHGLPPGYIIQPIVTPYDGSMSFTGKPLIQINTQTKQLNHTLSDPIVKSTVSNKQFSATINRNINPYDSSDSKVDVTYNGSNIDPQSVSIETEPKTENEEENISEENNEITTDEEPPAVTNWLDKFKF